MKNCAYCQAELVRRRFPSGGMETAKHFAERQYCSARCYHTGKVGKPHAHSGERADEAFYHMSTEAIAEALRISQRQVQRELTSALRKLQPLLIEWA